MELLEQLGHLVVLDQLGPLVDLVRQGLRETLGLLEHLV